MLHLENTIVSEEVKDKSRARKKFFVLDNDCCSKNFLSFAQILKNPTRGPFHKRFHAGVLTPNPGIWRNNAGV